MGPGAHPGYGAIQPDQARGIAPLSPGTNQEAQAADIKYHIQDADLLVQNTREMMRNVRARLSEIEQANHQTMQRINRI
ncbi:MAG: hypothetical protein GY737_13110 [Desulfobacteraceae bacterium]|nr:hypothetical protein [Desulfobacteraceae bacterium]